MDKIDYISYLGKKVTVINCDNISAEFSPKVFPFQATLRAILGVEGCIEVEVYSDEIDDWLILYDDSILEFSR